MALKDIRVTFFYADEGVFDQTKQWKTRERLVKWANEFYRRFGFKIDEYPIPYSEKIYRKQFSLNKTNGIKADYTNLVLADMIELALLKERLALADQETALLKRQLDRLEHGLPDDPDVAKARQDLVPKYEAVLQKYQDLVDLKSSLPEHEVQFRKLVLDKIKSMKGASKKQRLIVIFCWFVNLLELIKPNPISGETLDSDKNRPTFALWNFVAPTTVEVFTGPMILIGINQVTKKFDYALAHEIVHAAGNTTQDNEGSRGNIMIYADAEGKAPGDVNLEHTDKAKLEVSFFVS